MTDDINDNTLASPELIAALVRQIRTHVVDDDYEMALATRDKLYRVTLRTIAMGATDAVRLAQEALAAEDATAGL